MLVDVFQNYSPKSFFYPEEKISLIRNYKIVFQKIIQLFKNYNLMTYFYVIYKWCIQLH